MVAPSVGITDFASLDESVEFFLPVFEPHPHICGVPRDPEERVIISKTLVLIERGDRTKHAVIAFEADRGVDLTGESWRRGIEKILCDLAKLEISIERDGQWLRFLDLVGSRWTAGTTRENETKDGQWDSHDASMKREERAGVNFTPALAPNPAPARTAKMIRSKSRSRKRRNPLQFANPGEAV
jgi:hypothetical protein